eukprot:15118238-Alexandrium_andersonii.AAC.1
MVGRQAKERTRKEHPATTRPARVRARRSQGEKSRRRAQAERVCRRRRATKKNSRRSKGDRSPRKAASSGRRRRCGGSTQKKAEAKAAAEDAKAQARRALEMNAHYNLTAAAEVCEVSLGCARDEEYAAALKEHARAASGRDEDRRAGRVRLAAPRFWGADITQLRELTLIELGRARPAPKDR